ncbi:MAG: site-specific integrase [Actinomycetota bacterium]|nr:site-specific integrase [Actinomycetota bacterium]
MTIDGKRRKVSAPTKAEALKRAKELKSLPNRIGGLPARPTVAQWLDYWRTEVLPGTVKPTTEDSYASIIKSYLKPEIGHHKLDELTPAHVQQMLSALKRETKTHRALSPNTRRIALAVLRRSLKVAKSWRLVAENVATDVDGVRLESAEGRSLSPQEAGLVLAEIERSDALTCALLTLLLTTGMRKGEALGLRWDDFNWAERSVRVRRTLSRRPKMDGELTLYLAESPKNASSNRVVELVPVALEPLKRWKAEQKKHKAQRLLAAAPGDDIVPWGAGFPDDLVFTGRGRGERHGERGQCLDLSRPNDLLSTITKKLGLGTWTPHELRHTAASLMLGDDVALHTVSKVLGHSSSAITSKVYGHLVSGEKRKAANALEGVLISNRPIAAAAGS